MKYDVTITFHDITFVFDTTEHEDFNHTGQENPDASLDPSDRDEVHDYIRDFISDNGVQELCDDNPDVNNVLVKPAKP